MTLKEMYDRLPPEKRALIDQAASIPESDEPPAGVTTNTDPRPPETDDFDKRVIDVAALAIHRWKHPTVDLNFCSCRKDAEIAFEILETEAAGQWR